MQRETEIVTVDPLDHRPCCIFTGDKRSGSDSMEEDTQVSRDYSTNWDSDPIPKDEFATIIVAASGLAILVSLVILSGDSQAAVCNSPPFISACFWIALRGLHLDCWSWEQCR